MKKVLIAIDNAKILEQMKKSGKYILYDQDISYMEGVIEYLSQNTVDILITKDSLSGDITKEMYLKQIKLIAPDAKIILFVEKLTKQYKEFLFANEIFNIIEDLEVTFTKLFSIIESKENKVVYSYLNEIARIEEKPVKFLSKQIVCVFGTSGAGKSYISTVLGQLLSKKLRYETLLVDMDIQNPALDIYNNINGDINALYYVMEEVDNDCFNSNVLREVAKKAKENKKLSFLTNNLDMYECQNRIAPSYYKALYKEAVDNFDVTILDMPASPFLDVVPFSLSKADWIFFVINPNFISIRQAHKYLELMTGVWNISKQKIKLIINKISRNSLSTKQIESMLKDYEICLEIDKDENIEQVINGIKRIDIDKLQHTSKIHQIFGGISVDNLKRQGLFEKVLGVK